MQPAGRRSLSSSLLVPQGHACWALATNRVFSSERLVNGWFTAAAGAGEPLDHSGRGTGSPSGAVWVARRVLTCAPCDAGDCWD